MPAPRGEGRRAGLTLPENPWQRVDQLVRVGIEREAVGEVDHSVADREQLRLQEIRPA